MKKRTRVAILKLCKMVDSNMRGKGDALGMALQADEVRKCLKPRVKYEPPLTPPLPYLVADAIKASCGDKEWAKMVVKSQIRRNGGVERKPDLP